MKKMIIASIAGAWFGIPAWGQQATTAELAAQNADLEQGVREPCPAKRCRIRAGSRACANWKYAWGKS
jgi:hypothetical protein